MFRPLLALAVCLVAASSAKAQTPPRPNILFMFTADHAANAASAGGLNRNQTPTMDRLAKEGMLVKDCVVAYAPCGAGRAAIQTGKYAHLVGFYINGDKFDGSQQT